MPYYIQKKTCGLWRCEYQFVEYYYNYEKCKYIEYKSEPHETSSQNLNILILMIMAPENGMN